MRRMLTLLVSGLVAVVLGSLAVAGMASAVTTTDVEAKNAIEQMRKTSKQDPTKPQVYGTR
ncbi:MAG TPA: hypothetical protein VFX61_16720 [Micromonosporaceae bacterium]|nr:hypothetical protein [Micromonosporaceae bacterium]